METMRPHCSCMMRVLPFPQTPNPSPVALPSVRLNLLGYRDILSFIAYFWAFREFSTGGPCPS